MLEIGKTYTTAQFKEELNITKYVWENRKQDLFDHLAMFYKIQIDGLGRTTTYTILEQYGEYEPLPRKGNRQANNKIYQEAIIEIVKNNSLQTYTSMASQASLFPKVKELEHKVRTQQSYASTNAKEMFGTYKEPGGTVGTVDTKRVWCQKIGDHYVEMPLEEIKAFTQLFTNSKEDINEELLDVMDAREQGLITEQEMEKVSSKIMFGAYLEARQDFVMKYGYYPVKVSRYMLNAFKIQ